MPLGKLLKQAAAITTTTALDLLNRDCCTGLGTFMLRASHTLANDSGYRHHRCPPSLRQAGRLTLQHRCTDHAPIFQRN